MNIGNKIKNARESNHLTQEQAAQRLMVSRQTISNWETGKSLPDILSIMRMSELYNLSLDELLKEDKAMLAKMEKDAKARKTEVKIIKTVCIFLLLGVLTFALAQIFTGNPIVEFIYGATPWVLLGITVLLWLLSSDK